MKEGFRQSMAWLHTWTGLLFGWLARPERRAWVESLALTSALFAAVPIVNAFTVPRNLATGLMSGDGLFVAFDLAMLTLAAGFGFAARKAAQVKAAKSPRRARKVQEELATA